MRTLNIAKLSPFVEEYGTIKRIVDRSIQISITTQSNQNNLQQTILSFNFCWSVGERAHRDHLHEGTE